jgi:hypothetical protein
MGFDGVQLSSYGTSATEETMSPYCSPRMEAAVFSETLQPAVSNCMTPLYKLSSFSPSQIRKGHSLQFEKNNKKLTTECGATQTVKVIFCFA